MQVKFVSFQRDFFSFSLSILAAVDTVRRLAS